MEGTAKDKTKAKQRYLKRKKERRKHSTKKTEPGRQEEDEEEDEDEPPAKRQRLSEEPTPAALPTFPLPALPNPPSKSTLALQGLDKALADAELILPSTSLPTADSDVLSEKMRKRLIDLGVAQLFAVQTSLLPFLLPQNPLHRALYQPYHPLQDVCVSAPTGSGKTLAYVVPIVEILSSRIVTRLRALIVLPTRDLVLQVRETFEAIGKGRGLKIGTATGQHSFSHEQAQLVGDRSSSLLGGSSKIDILICTPGRLIDHLKETPNFSLQHLRFLVVDEADRLLAQTFQDWLSQVLAATRPPKQLPNHTLKDLLSFSLPLSSTDNPPQNISLSTSPDTLSPSFIHLLPYPSIPSFITEHKQSSCQKLLFSATLTSDPGKIAALELRNPKYFIVQGGSSADTEGGGGEGEGERAYLLDVVTEKFAMPDTLKEHMVICTTYQKPLAFFHLVLSRNIVDALVFTKSAESTSRLVKLLEFFQDAYLRLAREDGSKSGETKMKDITVRAYSSDLPSAERKSILEKFKAKEIQILVCSDLISRGIDISHVSHVVSYDSPVDMRKYVHRVGRTARAGREGDAWTLIEEQEARHFKMMMKEANHLSQVKRLRIRERDLDPLVSCYEMALSNLKDLYTRS